MINYNSNEIRKFEEYMEREIYFAARDSANIRLNALTEVYKKFFKKLPNLDKCEFLWGEHKGESKSLRAFRKAKGR